MKLDGLEGAYGELKREKEENPIRALALIHVFQHLL